MYWDQAMKKPKPPKSGPSFSTTCKLKVPRNQLDQAIAAELSAAFRRGSIYAYIYEAGTWTTWATETDWLATERNGRVRQATPGHGPTDWDRDELAAHLGLVATSQPRRKPGKAEYVAMLRRILNGTDWQVEELEALVAAA